MQNEQKCPDDIGIVQNCMLSFSKNINKTERNQTKNGQNRNFTNEALEDLSLKTSVLARKHLISRLARAVDFPTEKFEIQVFGAMLHTARKLSKCVCRADAEGSAVGNAGSRQRYLC
jgi:hypothetical protein